MYGFALLRRAVGGAMGRGCSAGGEFGSGIVRGLAMEVIDEPSLLPSSGKCRHVGPSNMNHDSLSERR
jgi:hypothetical protein